MSLISPVGEKLAVVYKPLMAVPFVQFLEGLGWRFVEVPDEEFASQGCNVLTVAPGKVLMLKDNPVTIQRLRDAGVEVHTYTGDEISHNRAGGPTCLTRPILRDTGR
jgi:N-dimethylarginine dimethylaminohydrolase